MKPTLSVIVTAYNRKEFLLEALQSAVNQTLKRDKYEIICIKNFKDAKIDKYIKDNGIISILEKEKPVGEYLYIATKKAKGKVLVFLDDDDLFSKDKLKRVHFAFSTYKVGFYHNLQLRNKKFQNEFPDIKENDFMIIKYPYKHSFSIVLPATANMSSIAIKRSILLGYSKELKNLVTNPDSLSFIISLISKADIFMDNNKLTFYRFHNKNTSYFKPLKKYLKFNKLVLAAYLYELELSDRNDIKLAKQISKRLLFLLLTEQAIKINKRKDLIKAFKYLSLTMFTDKRIIKRFVLLILFLFGSSYPYKRLNMRV